LRLGRSRNLCRGRAELQPIELRLPENRGYPRHSLARGAILLRRRCGLRHGHATNDMPSLPGPEPGMHDPRTARRPVAVLVHPSKRLPVSCHRNVPRDLNCSRLEIDGLKLQTLAGLAGDPVCNVILVDRNGTDRRPPKKTLMPQSRISGQVVLLNVVPIIVLKFPKRLRRPIAPKAHPQPVWFFPFGK